MIVLRGLLSGFSLIVAIGAQNAFVLRQGLRREHVGAVVLLCVVADVLLITAGTAGLGALVQAHPVALEVVRVAGALFLVLELDRPFGGLIQISSEPMRNALSNLGKWGL